MRPFYPIFCLLAGIVLFCADLRLLAQYPPAPLDLDEGGLREISGSITFSNTFFLSGASDAIILLEDQSGFVQRNPDYVIPRHSQTLGQLTSDIGESPVEYRLTLPTLPDAPLHRFATGQPGVMVFAISYWTNLFGDAYLEERDQLGVGWSTSYVSTRVSHRAAVRGEIEGGVLLVYAPEEGAAFPLDFGADERLFTEDDRLGLLPAGWTLVDLDERPFRFDRSRRARVNLIEGEAAQSDDFSRLTYSLAFSAMVDKFRREYAFTEHKGIDWDALEAEFLPRFAHAEERRDAIAYLLALRDFTWRIPDDHIDSNLVQALATMYLRETDGGIGLALRELDDGQIVVWHAIEGSPAALAGIERGAAILRVNGTAAAAWVDQAITWGGPYSTTHTERLQKLRYATRFPVGSGVTLEYRNPGQAGEATAQLVAVAEDASFLISSFSAGSTGFELPVAYESLGDGVLYASIRDFQEDRRLTVQLWERMLRTANEQGVRALILDLRNHAGGSTWLADQLAAYFFDEPLSLGNTGFYDAERDEFVFDAARAGRFRLPPEELRFRGQVALLLGPNCASACEFFAYNLTLQDRAISVGHYPTAGMGGTVERFRMPGSIVVQMTVGRAVNAQGQIHIEGRGVVPTLRVPVTLETLLTDGDAVLQAALAVIAENRSE